MLENVTSSSKAGRRNKLIEVQEKRQASFQFGLPTCRQLVMLMFFLRLQFINHVKPTGYVMHQQFNIQQLYALPTLYFVFCIYLRTDSKLASLSA